MWGALIGAAASVAKKNAEGGGAMPGTIGSTSVNVGGFNVPHYPFKSQGLDLSDPQTAVIVGAAVLIGGALILKAVR